MATMQLNRWRKKEISLMYESLETSGLIKKFGSPWLFLQLRKYLRLYGLYIQFFSPFQPRMQKSLLTNDLMPDNREQRKYKRNILCRITSPSVMHFMSSISGIHSGCAQAPGHLYNRAEREKERLDAQLYFPKLKHNRFGEC